mgnify:FL=1
MTSRARKVDDNQASLVASLRELPMVTVSTDHDDLLVGYGMRNYWFEVKNPKRCLNKHGELLSSALRPKQVELLATWRGHYAVVWNVEQIREAIQYAPDH